MTDKFPLRAHFCNSLCEESLSVVSFVFYVAATVTLFHKWKEAPTFSIKSEMKKCFFPYSLAKQSLGTIYLYKSVVLQCEGLFWYKDCNISMQSYTFLHVCLFELNETFFWAGRCRIVWQVLEDCAGWRLCMCAAILSKLLRSKESMFLKFRKTT